MEKVPEVFASTSTGKTHASDIESASLRLRISLPIGHQQLSCIRYPC